MCRLYSHITVVEEKNELDLSFRDFPTTEHPFSKSVSDGLTVRDICTFLKADYYYTPVSTIVPYIFPIKKNCLNLVRFSRTQRLFSQSPSFHQKLYCIECFSLSRFPLRLEMKGNGKSILYAS